MKNSIRTWLFACLLLCFALTAGCGTTKGYIGPKLPESELAVLRADEIREGTSPIAPFQTMYICQVDEKVVGSYYSGWPKEVYMTEGTHTIKLRYFNSKEPSVWKIMGGAIPGVIGESTEKHYYHTLELRVSPGRKYVVKLHATTINGEDVVVWIEDEETGEVLSGNRPSGENDGN